MPITPVTIYDSFTRSHTDTWGTSDSGQAWIEGTNAIHDMDGTKALIDVATTRGKETTYIDLSSAGVADQGSAEVLMKVKWTSSTTYPTTDFGPCLVRKDANTFYFVSLQGNYSEIAIQCYINGARYELDRASTTITKDVWYWVRFRSQSGRLKTKVWREGYAEPTAWLIDTLVYTGGGAPSAGDFGIFYKGTAHHYTINVAALYFYTLEEDEADIPFPITDTFERNVNKGWGWADSGALWYGSVADDPQFYTTATNKGSVVDDTDGYAQYTIAEIAERVAFIGRTRSGDTEALVSFSINSTAGNTSFRVGLRGQYGLDSNDNESGYGYAAEFVTGDNVLRIRKKSAHDGAWSTLATSGTITSFTTGMYWIRFQIVGTTLSARVWADGESEPGSFQVTTTDASFTSGQAWLSIAQTVTTTRVLKVFSVSYATPAPAGTNYTTTAALAFANISDTGATVHAPWTNDANEDNSATLKYKKNTTNTWTSVGAMTRDGTNSRFNVVLSGLEKNTTYDVSVTYSDIDSVVGTNPRTGSFTTTNRRLTTGVVTATNVTTTQADVIAAYSADSDEDSTAEAAYRTISSATQTNLDDFVGPSNSLLENHTPDIGVTWFKHPASTASVFIWNDRVFAKEGSGKAIYHMTPLPTASYYDVEATLNVFSLIGMVGITARQSASVETYYLGQYNALNSRWELVLVNSGVETVLAISNAVLLPDHAYNMKLIMREDYKGLIVDGIEVCFTTDATLTLTSGGCGLRFVGIATETTGFHVDRFTVTQRTSQGDWVVSGPMTADRTNRVFTRTITGLSADTVYEFRATFTDPDGIDGNNPIVMSSVTQGAAVTLTDLAFSPSATAVTVDVFYLNDTNNNSSISAEYRSITETIWTAVNAAKITVNRGAKKFTFSVSSLKPGITYEVMVNISDADGIQEGTSSLRTETFTTVGLVNEASLQRKHYIWKVYDAEGSYITTWNDAGVPEFGWDENGGVSDLSVTLPRKISSLNDPNGGIDFRNQIDIYCLDPSSDGFGPNLLVDEDTNQGSWIVDGVTSFIDITGGPDDSDAVKIVSAGPLYTVFSEPIFLKATVPIVVTSIVKAQTSKLQMYVEAYNSSEQNIDQSDDVAENVSTGWQQLRLEYTPPSNTAYVRIVFKNTGQGNFWADKIVVRPKELLIYRGRIESFTPKIDQTSEEIEVDILGLVSLLSDDYIEFLQFVRVQPASDLALGRTFYPASDPADMLRRVLAEAKRQNPKFILKEGTNTIHNTGKAVEYTFRDQQIRACFDKIRSLCPPGWHYFIEPDGTVHLRGPEHAPTHRLRLGVEIMNFSVEKSIKNLKNYIHVKGRQDDDNSEPNGHGSIHYTAFDQASIDKYGKRMMFIRDANIIDPDTAEIVGDGRLEELNREEQRAQCNIPDDKSIIYTSGSLKGYNIESLRPGDNVKIYDPVAGPNLSYWDQMVWDEDSWDIDTVFAPLPESVPIKTVQFHGNHALIELSERQPSQVGRFGQLYRYLQLQDTEKADQ